MAGTATTGPTTAAIRRGTAPSLDARRRASAIVGAWQVGRNCQPTGIDDDHRLTGERAGTVLDDTLTVNGVKVAR
jgi:hypothetical protein